MDWARTIMPARQATCSALKLCDADLLPIPSPTPSIVTGFPGRQELVPLVSASAVPLSALFAAPSPLEH